MALEEKLQDKIQRQQRKMKEISISLERLDRDYQKIFKELALTPEQLQTYMENPENFTPPIWEELQNEKKKLDEGLNLELTRVRDPKKLKKTYSENGSIQQHWLFVR